MKQCENLLFGLKDEQKGRGDNMPLCGFNPKMLKGIASFHEGLVEHGLIERSRKKGQTVEQALECELKDMDRMLGELNRISDEEKRKIIETLAEHAKAFYKLIESVGIDNYKEVVRVLNDFYARMDDKYYSELEGQKDDMKKLAEYLDSQKVCG
jgi:hypothetical protein